MKKNFKKKWLEVSIKRNRNFQKDLQKNIIQLLQEGYQDMI